MNERRRPESAGSTHPTALATPTRVLVVPTGGGPRRNPYRFANGYDVDHNALQVARVTRRFHLGPVTVDGKSYQVWEFFTETHGTLTATATTIHIAR